MVSWVRFELDTASEIEVRNAIVNTTTFCFGVEGQLISETVPGGVKIQMLDE